MSDKWYVYANKETLQVFRISPVLEDGTECHIVEIDKDLGIKFIKEPHLIDGYTVYFDGNKTYFIEKEKTKDVIVPFYYSPVMITEGVANPDILLVCKQVGYEKKLFVKLRTEKTSYAMSMYAHAEREKQMVQFYVSEKNDPNRLITVLYVDMVKLIQQGYDEFNFAYNIDEVSIFTRKIFDTYGLSR